ISHHRLWNEIRVSKVQNRAFTITALVSATDEVIYIYHLGNILIDPKWVLVKQIQNRAVDKSSTRFWYLGAYDGKSLVVRENEVIHVYDLSADEWGFVGWVPQWCDGFQNFHHFTLSLSSARELNEKVDVERVTPVRGNNGERISSLRKIMRLIDDSNPYALAWFKKNEKRLEEEKKSKMMVGEPSFSNVERISKRKRSSRKTRLGW
ncbi:PREDICTED: putative F-box protein At1g20800, partial [Camelina sativa]|uniref:F-box protein At1g20800 n=1 Tax=Camelina sativa TaxID=90675 RepID=A0ABM1R5Y6_CAMSA